MPRKARVTPGGMLFHVLNRGVGQETVTETSDGLFISSGYYAKPDYTAYLCGGAAAVGKGKLKEVVATLRRHGVAIGGYAECSAIGVDANGTVYWTEPLTMSDKAYSHP